MIPTMKESIKSKIKVDEKKITRCAPTTILPTIGKISPSENRTLIDYHVCQDDDDDHRLSYIFIKTIIILILIDIMIIITGLGLPSRPADRSPGCQTLQHPFLQQGDLSFIMLMVIKVKMMMLSSCKNF